MRHFLLRIKQVTALFQKRNKFLARIRQWHARAHKRLNYLTWTFSNDYSNSNNFAKSRFSENIRWISYKMDHSISYNTINRIIIIFLFQLSFPEWFQRSGSFLDLYLCYFESRPFPFAPGGVFLDTFIISLGFSSQTVQSLSQLNPLLANIFQIALKCILFRFQVMFLSGQVLKFR